MSPRLILLGGGHTHALLLHHWAKQKSPTNDIIVVTPDRHAVYSGMIPGWLAGEYQFEQLMIDMGRLCQQVGAQLKLAHATQVDGANQRIVLDNGQSLAYDYLSINVGSTIGTPKSSSTRLLGLRPLLTLRTHYQNLLATLAAEKTDQALQLTVVGGGAAAFEVVLAIKQRLQALCPQRQINSVLQVKRFMPDMAPPVRDLCVRALHANDVLLKASDAVTTPIPTSPTEIVVYATGAQAHDWQSVGAANGRLAVNDAGFIAIDHYLRTQAHDTIFAAGDCAGWQTPLAKSGVYAVRMAPILAHNVYAAVTKQSPLKPYRPQKRFLALLRCGAKNCIASYGRLALQGRWLWRLKDRIDRRFIDQF